MRGEINLFKERLQKNFEKAHPQLALQRIIISCFNLLTSWNFKKIWRKVLLEGPSMTDTILTCFSKCPFPWFILFWHNQKVNVPFPLCFVFHLADYFWIGMALPKNWMPLAPPPPLDFHFWHLHGFLVCCSADVAKVTGKCFIFTLATAAVDWMPFPMEHRWMMPFSADKRHCANPPNSYSSRERSAFKGCEMQKNLVEAIFGKVKGPLDFPFRGLF